MRCWTLALLTVVLFSPQTAALRADDWPQWMGPGRDNVWRETGIVERLPEGGPQVLWRAPVANGYAGPAVAKGRVFVADFATQDDVKVPNFERKAISGTERVLCLEEATGKELWRYEVPVTYTISFPAGPRCTPTVHGDKVYTLGAEGHLCCLDAATGKEVWSKSLTEEYHTKAPIWGYASHPLAEGNKLICVVGGEGTHTVAFDLETGKELWRAYTSRDQGYAPPTIIEAGGVRQLISFRPDAVSSCNPDTGQEYWSVPYEATHGMSIMSPVKSGDYLFVGGHENQNLLIKLARDKPFGDVEWGNLPDGAMSPVNVQPFVDGEIMYGFHGNGELMAVELPSGKRLWETSAPVGDRPAGSGTAFLVRQGDRTWLFNEKGELLIAKLSRDGYEELARAKIIAPTNNAFGRDVIWSMPAFANRRVYVRNDAECICVDLAAK